MDWIEQSAWNATNVEFHDPLTRFRGQSFVRVGIPFGERRLENELDANLRHR